jgi:hypothetical protein
MAAMDITRRLIGTSAILKDTRDTADVDLNGIIRRLILFDTYILKSIRLLEFPPLIAALGFADTMQLLKSTAFKIECESVTTGQMGQTGFARAAKGVLPPLSYSFSGIDTADHEKYVHVCLQPLHKITGLTHKQVLKLKQAIVYKMERLPEGFAGRVATQATEDVLKKQDLVMKSVATAARRTLGVELPDFRLSVHQIDSEDFRVETDLPKRIGIDIETTHKVVERGLLGIAELSSRFAEMEAYSALSGFIDDDLPLVYERLDFLAHSISPETKERQFRRVLEIAGFPDVAPAVSGKRVNITRLLEIRESDECREFRQWLPTIETISDTKIQERLDSLRAKLGNAMQSGVGRALRLLVTSGMVIIPGAGLIAGAVAGAVDTFLMEKLLPKSGVIAFISNLYPSVFDEPTDR